MTRLRELRLRRLLTIRGLAKEAGVAPNTIYFTEAGQRVPRFASMKRIAAALGVEPLEIDEFRSAIEGAIEGKAAA